MNILEFMIYKKKKLGTLLSHNGTITSLKFSTEVSTENPQNEDISSRGSSTSSSSTSGYSQNGEMVIIRI